MTNPLVSIIIPNWNGLHHLPDCLSSLHRQGYQPLELVLVDNGSTDGSVEWVTQHYPQVQLIALEQNQGFAPACNLGLRAAQGEFLILLNNDTEVAPDWLRAVIDTFERHPQAGSVASKMLLFDQRDHIHTAGDFYRLDGIPGNRGVWQKDEGQFDQETPVFSACGGSAAYRRAMLEQIGLLDEKFYFSCEDVDLGWRAQLSGWACIYTPKAIIYHKLGATGGGAIHSFYNGRNFIYLLVKDYPTSLWRRYWLAILCAQWRITHEALRAWRGQAARARLRGQLAGVLGIPNMLRARRYAQRTRRVSDAQLLRVLTPLDE